MFTRARTLTLARAATADGNAGIPQRRWLHLHLQTPKPPHRREVLVEWNFRPDAILRRTGLDDCDLGTLFHPDDAFAELVVQYVAGVEDVGFCYFDTDGGIRQGGKQADVALTLGGSNEASKNCDAVRPLFQQLSQAGVPLQILV